MDHPSNACSTSPHADRLGLYVHVPFCSSRCGYCDFNTYTPKELAGLTGEDAYLEAFAIEVAHAREALAKSTTPDPCDTVFFGGGTPSMLGADNLVGMLKLLRDEIGLAEDAEVTTEANPESTSEEFFARLKAGGFTRVSLGMQSNSEKILQILGRKHTPGRALAAAEEALAAGIEHVNLDMIYGTPTETHDDVRRTVEAIISTGVDHVSAYSLIVEQGTAFARQVARGELTVTGDDEMAERYWLIDEMLSDAGFMNYEVSNWARPGGECRHNLIYWRGANFWGFGPGAHSLVDGQRFSNVKHPARYHEALSQGGTPVDWREELSADDLHFEALMLRLRLREGLPLKEITPSETPVVEQLKDSGILETYVHDSGETMLRLTSQSRLLSDGIVTQIAASGDE